MESAEVAFVTRALKKAGEGGVWHGWHRTSFFDRYLSHLCAEAGDIIILSTEHQTLSCMNSQRPMNLMDLRMFLPVGMTPTTASAAFCAEVMAQGFHIELAGGGQVRKAILFYVRVMIGAFQ